MNPGTNINPGDQVRADSELHAELQALGTGVRRVFTVEAVRYHPNRDTWDGGREHQILIAGRWVRSEGFEVVA